jgi:translation initiation factor IF-3
MKIIDHNPACRLLDYAFDYWQTQARTAPRKNPKLIVKPANL